MKKNIWVLLMSLFLITPVFAYENQGFTSYKEDREGKISFSCAQQCVIVLGDKSQSDYLKIDWLFQWNGQIAYGFAVGQNVAPAWNVAIQWNAQLSQKFLFSDFQALSQIPSDAKVLLLIQWSVQVNWATVNAAKFSFGQKIKNWISQALTYKPYAPTTINFLDWPMWNWKHMNEQIFFLIILIIIIGFLKYNFSNSYQSKKK